jgi:hypothetical protein
LVCGVDCGKFEVLLKDYDWHTDADTVFNPLTAKQTCWKYSDYNDMRIPNSSIPCCGRMSN